MKHLAWRDIALIAALGAVIFAAILAPAYVINEQEKETDRIIAEIEEESQRRLEQAINVNTYTISCLLAIPPEDRTDQVFRACIEAGFEQAESQGPDTTISPSLLVLP